MSLLADTRLALRRLGQSPGYTLAAIGMLGVGIALAALMSGVLRGLLGSLPFPDADRVVVVQSHSAEQQVRGGMLTPAEAMRLAEGDGPFAAFGYYGWNGMTVRDGERPREITIIQVSQGFFPALGMPPLLGRWFLDEDFGSDSQAVILAHHEWQRLFGGDPEVLGRVIEGPTGERHVVVGVMPAAFAVPSDEVGVWRPVRGVYPLDQPWTWNARFVNAVARLPAAVPIATVNDRLRAIGLEVAERYGLPAGQWQIAVRPLLEAIVGDLRGVLWASLAIALLVLLIGCANVALLIDARQTAQRHQQAVLQALGASRARLYRALLLELALLGLGGALLGLLLSLVGIEALRELAHGSLPRADAIGIDGAVIGIALGLGLLLPFVSLLAGSLRVRGEAVDAMRSGGKGLVGGVGRRPWLPTVGVALSTVSLVAGSALLFSLLRLQQVDPGFRSEQVYALQLFRNGSPDQQRQFADQLQERLRAMPGVQQVALTTAAPLSNIGRFSADLQLPERSQPEPFRLGVRRVSKDYLDLLGIRLLAGRGIENEDRAGSEKVAVINQALAQRTFGDESPIGRRIALPMGQGPRIEYRVVGVMADIHNEGLRQPPGPELLIPYAGDPTHGITFLLRAARPIAGFEDQLADVLFEVDPQEASTRIFALADDLGAQLLGARFFARTIGGFALAALLLAAFGVYAVASLRQQQRVAEFGLRLAIGAQPGALVGQSLADSGRAVVLGVVLGLAGAWAVLRLLRAQLFGLEQAQLGVVLSGVGVLLAAAFLAALLPALRAARVDPMTALRHD